MARVHGLAAHLCLVALGVAAASLPAQAQVQAGVAAAVRGRVSLARAAATARPVVSGEDVLMQDILRSGPSSGMQILLLDETAFTIGPLSELVVDQFVYDPSTSAGKVSATVVKGVFRFVTGKIAKKNPSDMQVSLPSGNIGVRGTIVGGRADDVTRASLVVLLGDSQSGTTGRDPASIEVCNAGSCEEVATAGFGVRIEGPDAPPTRAFRIPVEEVEAILQEVGNPEGVRTTGVDESAGALDEGVPLGGEDARETRRRLQGLDRLDTLSDRAAQDARGIGQTPSVPQEPIAPPVQPPVQPPTDPSPGFPTSPKGGSSRD